MKTLQKVFAALLCLAMVFSLAACGGEGSAPAGDNTAPEISGVFDQAVEAGTAQDHTHGAKQFLHRNLLRLGPRGPYERQD